MSVHIRRATLEDLAALVAMEEAAFSEQLYHRVNRRQYLHLLTKGNAEIWMATDGETLLGVSILLFRKNGRTGRLYSLAVDPASQGQGVGRALIQHAIQNLKDQGLVEFRQEVRRDNDILINRYLKMGFVISGQVDEYYPDGMSCLKLKKDLAVG